MKFTGILVLGGKTATGIEVPADVVTALGPSKRPPVTVTLRGYSYPSTVAPMGGSYWIPVSAEVRAAAGVTAGDEVEVTLERDDKPREVAVPEDFAAAIAADAAAKSFWDGLSYSNRRRLVMQVDAAKTADTRTRRIDKIVAGLGEGKT